MKKMLLIANNYLLSEQIKKYNYIYRRNKINKRHAVDDIHKKLHPGHSPTMIMVK